MPLCKIFLHTQSHLPASQHQFLDDTKIKISSKNWRWLADISLSKYVVSNQYDTKRHMCLKNDTTQYDTK